MEEREDDVPSVVFVIHDMLMNIIHTTGQNVLTLETVCAT